MLNLGIDQHAPCFQTRALGTDLDYGHTWFSRRLESRRELRTGQKTQFLN